MSKHTRQFLERFIAWEKRTNTQMMHTCPPEIMQEFLSEFFELAEQAKGCLHEQDSIQEAGQMRRDEFALRIAEAMLPIQVTSKKTGERLGIKEMCLHAVTCANEMIAKLDGAK